MDLAGLRGGRAQAVSKRWALPLLTCPLCDVATQCGVLMCAHLPVRSSRLQRCHSRRTSRAASIRFQPRPLQTLRSGSGSSHTLTGSTRAAPWPRPACNRSPDAAAANFVQLYKHPSRGCFEYNSWKHMCGPSEILAPFLYIRSLVGAGGVLHIQSTHREPKQKLV